MLWRIGSILTVFALSTVVANADVDRKLCSDRDIAAQNVRTRSDVKAFVECAHELVATLGADKAYQRFHLDSRWMHDEIYLFVFGLNPDPDQAWSFLNTRDPETEGRPVGQLYDDYGGEIIRAGVRVIEANRSGWFYYQFVNPDTGQIELKSSYAMALEWNGRSAWIGAGGYFSDLPGSCKERHVSSAMVHSAQSEDLLREFVRCASYLVELEGYSAVNKFRNTQQWNDGLVYIFGLDLTGNQVFTGNRISVNGVARHEWGEGGHLSEQFNGRDIVTMADTFGEAFIYYRSPSPVTGDEQKKVGFLKRTVSYGVPLLIGASYFVEPLP